MKIYHILAMSENRVIGEDNEIPWTFTRDMERFMNLTYGHTILMGRKTFDSLGGGPLRERNNIVVSRSLKEISKGRDQIKAGEFKYFEQGRNLGLCNSIGAALNMVENIDLVTDELYIIGGGEIYRQTLDLVDEIRMTIIHDEYEGNVFYPELDNSEWCTSWSQPGDQYSFVDLVRKSNLQETF